MKINKKQVGKRIRSLRHSHNLTLEEVAKEIHAKGKSTVNAWERGATIPSKGFLKALCSLFDVSEDYLFFGSVDEYLLNLIIDDYQSEDSLTRISIENYLNLSSERLDFMDSLPFNYSQDEAPNIAKDADTNAIKDIVTSDLQSLKKFLGAKLKYNNDREILKMVSVWFNNKSTAPMNSFLGEYRQLRHYISLSVPGVMGAGNKTVSEVMKSPNISNKRQAIDLIYRGKLSDLHLKMLQELSQLKESYEKEIHQLDD